MLQKSPGLAVRTRAYSRALLMRRYGRGIDERVLDRETRICDGVGWWRTSPGASRTDAFAWDVLFRYAMG